LTATRKRLVCSGCIIFLQRESNKFLLGLKNSGGSDIKDSGANGINRGYHGCDDQKGTIIVPHALSNIIFFIVAAIKANEETHKTFYQTN